MQVQVLGSYLWFIDLEELGIIFLIGAKYKEYKWSFCSFGSSKVPQDIMKGVILALALFQVANADHAQVATYAATTTCSGSPIMLSSAVVSLRLWDLF